MPDFLSNLKINQVSLAGPVVPMSFVTNDPNQDYCCRQATATTDMPLGVAQIGADITPGLQVALFPASPTPTIYAGQPGSQIQIFSVGDVAPIRIGAQAGTIKNGTFLTNDSAGLAIPIAAFTANQFRGGVALHAGSPGEIIELFLLPGNA